MDAEDAARSTLGFDLTAPTFWEEAFAPLEARVDAFAQIAIPGHASI
jgi:oligoendopeptidase F